MGPKHKDPVIQFTEELVLFLRKVPATLAYQERLMRYVRKGLRENIGPLLQECVGGDELLAILQETDRAKRWTQAGLSRALILTGRLNSIQEIRKETNTMNTTKPNQPKPLAKPPIKTTNAPATAPAAPSSTIRTTTPPGQITITTTNARRAPSLASRMVGKTAPMPTGAPPRLPVTPPAPPPPVAAPPATPKKPRRKTPAEETLDQQEPMDIIAGALRGHRGQDLLDSVLSAAQEQPTVPAVPAPKRPPVGHDPLVRLRALEVLLQLRRIQIGALPFGHPSHTAALEDVNRIAEEVSELADHVHIAIEVPTQKQIADEERVRRAHVPRTMID